MFEVGRPGYSGTWGLVVRASGVDKGTAIDWVARHHGVTAAEVVAVGDWLNDIPMLRRAGRSFAMAQAPNAVKAAATDILKANHTSGGGLAEAAIRAGLL
jgi:hydroxymethylpyrimidine pyrophosphatase-like HAD family hydrolase